MAITWPLLLSLSFLLHRVTSQAAETTTIPDPNPELTAKHPTTTGTKASVTTTQTVTPATTPVAAATTTALTTAATTTTTAPTTTAAPTTAAPTTTAVTTTAPTTTALPTTATHETKSPTGAPTTTHNLETSSVASQASSASTTVANVPVATGTTVHPTTLNPPDQSTAAVKKVGTDKPAERSTLPHTEAASGQPTGAAATPTPLGPERASTAPTNAAARGSGTIETTSRAVTIPPTTTTTRSQQGTKVTSGPGTTSITADSNTPTPTSVVPNPSTARTRDESLDRSSVTAPAKTGPAQPQLKTFEFSLKSKNEEQREFVEVCKRLMVNMEDGKCVLKWQNDSNKVQFQSVEITGAVKLTLANQYHDELTKKPTDNTTLIAILASCGALLVMIIILAACASHHRRPYNETQQHLTEELHTVENGYHDNPTLEVMEVQPEMQEKKMALNGEFNDSWIVPMDNLLKEDAPDEEDTHL